MATSLGEVQQEAPVKSHIRLSYTDQDGRVFVDGDQGDRFLLTVQQAVFACGAFNRMADFQTQMSRLIERLNRWGDSQQSKVKEAYLTVRGSGLFYLVVSRDSHHDGELEDALTEVDIEVANDEEFNLIKMEVLAIPDSPKDCVESFLSPVPLGKADA